MMEPRQLIDHLRRITSVSPLDNYVADVVHWAKCDESLGSALGCTLLRRLSDQKIVYLAAVLALREFQADLMLSTELSLYCDATLAAYQQQVISLQQSKNWESAVRTTKALMIFTKGISSHRSLTSTVASNDAVSVSKEVVSALDPLSKRRMTVPVRGSRCRHRQPTDLFSLLQLPMDSKPSFRWKCCICGGPVALIQLQLDEVFCGALTHFPEASRFSITLSQESSTVVEEFSPCVDVPPPLEEIIVCGQGEQTDMRDKVSMLRESFVIDGFHVEL